MGYTQVNIDAGWLKGRFPNGTIYEDLELFPSGYVRVCPCQIALFSKGYGCVDATVAEVCGGRMAGLGSWIKSQETAPGSGRRMRYGLYSCRGSCQCGTSTYAGPGSLGYEKMVLPPPRDTVWTCGCTRVFRVGTRAVCRTRTGWSQRARST